MVQNEVAILRRVKHPNVVLLIEEMDTYSELYLVMELVKVLSTFLMCWSKHALCTHTHAHKGFSFFLCLRNVTG